MKKLGMIFISVLLLVFAISSFAATDLKIGVVDIALIQAKSPKFMQVQKEMQDSLAASQKKINDAQSTLRDEYSQSQDDVAKMSAAKRKQLDSKIAKDKNNLVALSKELSAKETKLRQNTMLKMGAELNAAITQVAKQEGLNLILTKQAAVYVDSQAVDVTKQVAEIFG